MEIMKPMGLNSTPFISYHEIDVEEINLLEDAWGLNSEFCDVIVFLDNLKVFAPKPLTTKLMERVRKHF
jgi:hypothetical protein